MALSNNDEAIIRDYLLGKLNDDEQQKVEERLMVEDELFEEFEVSKDELVGEYVAGELPQKEHEWFRTHFLASPEGRQRHAFVLAMDELRRRPAEPNVLPKPGWWERFRSLLNNHTWTVGLAGTAMAAIVVAVWVSRPQETTVIGPTLTGTIITRGEGPQPAKVQVDRNASKLRLRLLLPSNTIPATGYRAELDDRLNVKTVTVVDYNAEGVWVEIPVDLIPPGEYSLQLIAIKPDSSEERVRRYYQFNVER